MSIPVGESIGLEVHPDTDQFLRLDAGKGTCVMGPAKDQLDFEQEVSDGWSIQVPAGSWHDVVNTGDEPLRLYAIYAPVHHAPGIVQRSSADAERDEAAGVDEPRPGACSPRAAPRTSTPTDLPERISSAWEPRRHAARRSTRSVP